MTARVPYKIFNDIIQNLAEQNATLQNIYYSLSVFSSTPEAVPVEYAAFIFVIAPCTIETGTKSISCLRGNTLMLRNPGTYIIRNTEQDKTSAFVLAVKKDFIDDIFLSQIVDCPLFYDFIRLEPQAGSEPQFLFFDNDSRSPVYLCSKILLYHASFPSSGNLKAVRCACILFLTTLHITHQEHLVISTSSMMPEYQAGCYLKFISDNFRTITLESTAAHFGFTPAYFSTLFKRLEQCTFSRKLQEIRIEHAKQMLQTTSLPVGEVMKLSGFSEKSSFHRTFKKMTGMTPGGYVQQLGK